MGETQQHRSGFVNIVGKPNAGKSTLMNALVGERMSIITRKPQTTRHRICGILSGEDFQIVFSDTPGFVADPSYKMHSAMNQFIRISFEDADLILFMVDATEPFDATHPIIPELQKAKVPIFTVLNKMDLVDEKKIEELIEEIGAILPESEIVPISALKKKGVDKLMERINDALPEGPAYYPKDQLTDKPERFFVSEIIREKILDQYHEEIPYSCEIAIESYKEDVSRKGPIIRIRALIYVMRKSQKAIIIGKRGESIKKLGTAARKEIETFLDNHVFLELHVKVRDNWRDDERMLKYFGYKQ